MHHSREARHSWTPRALADYQVTCCTYASIALIEKEPFDLLVADEAHHIAGDSNKRAAAATDDRVAATFRLFMTATPKIFSDDCQFSMDDPLRFGPVADTLTFGEAIRLGILCDYRILISGVETKWYLRSGGRSNMVAVQARAIDRAIEQGYAKSLISFHPTIAAAERLRSALEESAFDCFLIQGNDPVEERRAAISTALSRSEPVVFASCRALSEGVDVPAVDGVVFSSEKTSTIDIVQSVGRALRLDPEKPEKVASVLLPVPLPYSAGDGVDSETVYRSHGWRVVQRALRGLGAHDERLSVRLAQQRAGVHQARAIEIDVPEPYRGPLQLLVIETATTSRWRTYDWIKRWVRNGGDLTTVRSFDVVGGFQIGRRIADLRHIYGKEMLDPGLAKTLEKLPGWSWTIYAEKWERVYNEVAHVWLNGSVSRKRCEGAVHYEKLRHWISFQKSRQAAGTLEAERVQLMEELECWHWNKREAYFLEQLERLRRFVHEHGHARPEWNHQDEDGTELGKWVDHMRQSLKKGHLANDRRALLESLPGWTWAPRKDGFLRSKSSRDNG